MKRIICAIVAGCILASMALSFLVSMMVFNPMNNYCDDIAERYDVAVWHYEENGTMDKVYYLHIVYAPCGVDVKGFTPTVFRVNFSDKQTMLRWINDPKGIRFAAELHARKTGSDIDHEILQRAIYLDSGMCRELGFSDDGTTLADVVCDMFKHWIDHMTGFGKFPAI